MREGWWRRSCGFWSGALAIADRMKGGEIVGGKEDYWGSRCSLMLHLTDIPLLFCTKASLEQYSSVSDHAILNVTFDDASQPPDHT